jgi:hypothetical protein
MDVLKFASSQHLRHEKELYDVRLRCMEQEQMQTIKRLEGLKGLDIDLTRVLIAEQRAPDKLYRQDLRKN